MTLLHIPSMANTTAGSFSITENLVERLADSWVISSVLFVLIAMSIGCWFIIAYKWLYFRRLESHSRAFVDAFWKMNRLDELRKHADGLPGTPVAELFKAGHTELMHLQGQASDSGRGDESAGLTAGFDNIERALKRARLGETSQLERLVPFLATTGSAAPFIGLFGTVWGIMEAFAQIDPTRNLLTSVAPHIAEALVATAIGLLAAIPAVIAYNYFVRRIRLCLVEIDSFSVEFLNIVRRHFF